MPTPLHIQAMHPGTRRPGATAYLMLLPIATWLAALVILPALLMLAYSFCSRDELGDVLHTFTTDNYRRAFSPTYLRVLLRSTELAALTTLLCLLIGYPAAYFIGRSSPSLRPKLLLLLMIPFSTSFLIRAYAWITILKDQGLLNALLAWTRAIPTFLEPTSLLYTPTAVLIGMTYSYLPFMMLPIYVSAEKLDPHLLEASADLGASPLRTFLHVTLPLTKPGVYAGTLLTFVPAIGMFAIQDLLGGAKTPLAGSVIQSQFSTARDLPFGAALATLLLLLFLLTFPLLHPREHPQ